jgi:hypothetical protein
MHTVADFVVECRVSFDCFEDELCNMKGKMEFVGLSYLGAGFFFTPIRCMLHLFKMGGLAGYC